MDIIQQYRYHIIREELKQLRQALAEHVSMCHARSRKARESIALAKTKAEVDKISFNINETFYSTQFGCFYCLSSGETKCLKLSLHSG